MSDWEKVKFSELFLIGSLNGVTRPSRVRGKGFKMVNMKELFKYDRLKNQKMELVPMTPSELSKFGLTKGDLLFARQSLTIEGAGKCSIVIEVPEEATFESHLIRIRLNSKKASSLFYYYFFSSSLGKGTTQSIVYQVAAAGLRASDLALLKIPLPPLPTQKKIAHILSTYDDLIENNQKRIAILEQMAQNLYKEWFVRFRFPNWEEVEFVDGVPKGWEELIFTEISDLINGGTPSTKVSTYWNGTIPFFSPKDVNNSFFCFETESKITEEGLRNCSSKLFNVDTLFITARGTVGKIALNAVPMAMNQSNYALIGKKGISQYYLFLVTHSLIKRLRKQANGATFSAITVKDFESLKVLHPPNSILEKFDKVIIPLFEEMKLLKKKNLNLKQARNRLLPRLLSGKLKV